MPKKWSKPEALFNGKDLSGWTVDSDDAEAWKVEGGELINRVVNWEKGWLLTDRDYADFVLRLEFLLPRPRGIGNDNSGVFVRFRNPRRRVPDRTTEPPERIPLFALLPLLSTLNS